MLFNLIKSLCFIFIGGILSIILVFKYNNYDFIYCIMSTTVVLIAESIVAPIVIYLTAKFNQKLVSKVSISRSIFTVIILLGLLKYPTLKYIFFKDLIISIFYITTWIILLKKINKFRFFNLLINRKFDFELIKESFFNYSIWTHLIGVVANFIYRADTFFLSFFSTIDNIGDYTVALNSANVANILPSILNYQNSVAISNVKDKPIKYAKKLTRGFLIVSIIIGLVTMFGFIFFGKFYLNIITGNQNNDKIYIYMICIVLGLVISKTLSSPLASFICILGSIRKFFLLVSLPTLILCGVFYFFSAMMWGSLGIAISNIFVAIFLETSVIILSYKSGFTVKVE